MAKSNQSARIFWDCAMCGAIGTFSGFAVFILSWEEETSFLEFAAILVSLAVFAYAFEYIRSVIDGHNHPTTKSRILVGLLLVAIFEMFIMAIHSVLSAHKEGWRDIGTAVLGPLLAQKSGPVINVIAMALLWVIMGSALGAGLSLAIRPSAHPQAMGEDRGEGKGLGAVIGILTGAVGAPLVVVTYILFSRLIAEVGWMLDKPDEWAQNADDLFDRLPSYFFVWPLKLLVGFAALIGQHIHGPWGPIVAIVGIITVTVGLFASTEERDRNWIHYSAIGAPIVILGAPLLGTSLSRDLRTVGTLFLLVTVVWGIPGLLLGALVPYLRRPSENRKLWAFVAWLTACALVLFVRFEGYYLVAGLLALLGLAIWKGFSIEEYWPIIALCLAAFVLTVTRISQSANFFYIQDLSRVLVSEPLAKVSPSARWASFEARFLLLGQRVQAFTTVDQWMGLATTELTEGKQLLTDTKTVSDQLSKKVAKDHELTDQLSEHGLKVLKEVMRARSLPEITLEDAKKQADVLTSAQKECRDLLGRVLLRLDLSRHYDVRLDLRSLQPTAEEKMKRQEMEMLIQNLASREQEIRAGLPSLEGAEQKLEIKLAEKNNELAQRFELCLNGCLGFWIPMGLLAGWARARGSEKHESGG